MTAIMYQAAQRELRLCYLVAKYQLASKLRPARRLGAASTNYKLSKKIHHKLEMQN